MRVLDIIPNTVVDGPHLRTSIYVAGCLHRCPGCHNPESWSFEAGREMTPAEAAEEMLSHGSKRFTISGGDPMYTAGECSELCRIIREKTPGADIWLYTGFTVDEIEASGDPDKLELLSLADTVVDGPYVDGLRDVTLRFMGSLNQRIIDMNERRKS